MNSELYEWLNTSNCQKEFEEWKKSKEVPEIDQLKDFKEWICTKHFQSSFDEWKVDKLKGDYEDRMKSLNNFF